MPTQAQIEQAAGIDKAVAKYIDENSTPATRQVVQMLKLCVACYETAAAIFLKMAVEECKREIELEKL